jgi:hypothetical protein
MPAIVIASPFIAGMTHAAIVPARQADRRRAKNAYAIGIKCTPEEIV